MEIPKDAKVCPNCRKKQGGIGKWIVIAVIVVALIAAISGGGEDKPKKVENDPINIDTISFGLYIPGNLLWEFNLSAEVIFSPDFIRNILLILVLFLT